MGCRTDSTLHGISLVSERLLSGQQVCFPQLGILQFIVQQVGSQATGIGLTTILIETFAS
jgi:hypothetical protein